MEKKNVLKAIQKLLKENINQLNVSLESFEAAANLDEGDTMDPDDYSKQSEYKEMQMQMQVQLDMAVAHLDKLDTLSDASHETAETGALVETDTYIFFLGIPFPKTQFEGKELLGVSTETPAFVAIRGKSKGESFQLGNEEHVIVSIS